MKSYLVGTDAGLALAEYDRAVAGALCRGIAAGGFGVSTLTTLWLWPAHPLWSFLFGFGLGAPAAGVVALVLRTSRRGV